MLLNTQHPTWQETLPPIKNYADSNGDSDKVDKFWSRLSYIALTNLQIPVSHKKQNKDTHSCLFYVACLFDPGTLDEKGKKRAIQAMAFKASAWEWPMPHFHSHFIDQIKSHGPLWLNGPENIIFLQGQPKKGLAKANGASKEGLVILKK